MCTPGIFEGQLGANETLPKFNYANELACYVVSAKNTRTYLVYKRKM